ncbi:LysM peptidoglycan-binding domain-containing protein [Intrasporangium sp.]|uniref:LysM peptidoglycan-binding domain-containing protein n=1 Tax=Intrasporangium sp. TaxID=1925024 RepID=UPI003221830D
MSALTVQPILDPAAPRLERPRLVLVPTGPTARRSCGPAPAGPLRVTRRGRLLLLLGVTLLLAAAGLTAATMLTSAPTRTHAVTVQAGQTLSGIAAGELPGVPLRDAIVEIQLANSLSTDQVHSGQTLMIPAG